MSGQRAAAQAALFSLYLGGTRRQEELAAALESSAMGSLRESVLWKAELAIATACHGNQGSHHWTQ